MPGDALQGRAAELEAAAGALDAVASGERRVLTVVGEAGIGKTRLLAEIARRAQDAGFVLVEGRGTELEGTMPLVPVLEAIGPSLADKELLAGLPSDRSALLTGLGEGVEAGIESETSGGERWRLYRALAELLPLIAEDRPLLLLIDDLHWADTATVELVAHLIRRPPGDSLAIAVGMRPGPIADRLRVERSSSAIGKVQLELWPLDRPAAEPILAAIPEPGERDRIFAASGGNPLLLEELVRGGGHGEVPSGVVAAVRAELEELAPAPRALLEAAAVAGDPFDLDLAAAIAGLPQDDALAALDQLAAALLVRPTGPPRRFTFRHPVVRTAIYEGLGAGGRLAAHAAAAAALERIEAPLPDRARHLAQAATPGDEDAAAALRAAAASVRPRVPEVAAGWLLAARRVAPAKIDTAVLVETLIEAGRWQEALDALDLDGDAAGSPDLALIGASIERQLGRHEASQRRLMDAYAAAESDKAASRIAADLAVAAYQRGDYGEISTWATRIGPADAVGAISAIAGTLRAVGSIFAGDTATGATELRIALDELEAADDGDLALIAEPAMAIPWGLLALDRLPEGLETAQRIAAAAQGSGNPLTAIPHQFAAVLALGLLGRMIEAEALADEAEQAARVSGVAQLLQWALWLRGWVLMERGKLDEALDAVRESVDLGAELDDSASSMVARVVLGGVLATRGEHELGRPMLDDYDIDHGWVCRWAPLLVESDLALDDLDAAREHAARAAELAPGTGMAGARASTARAQALVALAENRDEVAATLARRAIAEADAADAALEAARARILAGRALIATDRDAGVAELGAAARLAAECGAPRVEGEARRELRRAGVRVGGGGRRAAGDQGLDSLSPREIEVAHLVSEGMTNREIGARLFLSEKTVESHLTHVFQKLGLRSRAQVAVEVAKAANA